MGRTLTEQALNLFLPHIASRTAPPGQRSLLRELEKSFGFITPEHSTALQEFWFIVTSSILVLLWRTRVEIVYERQRVTVEESTQRVWTACVMQVQAVAHRMRALKEEKINATCLSQLLSVLERQDLSRQLEAWRTAGLYFDGGARGNPGPGGSGWALIFLNERSNRWELKACGYAYMGPEVTNNWCEYSALKDGLACSAHYLQHYEVKLEVFGDSQMIIVSQNGFASIRQTKLQPLAVRVNQITANFAWTSWNHTKREQNKMADLLANMAMNSKNAKILTDESRGNDQVLLSQVAALLDNDIGATPSKLRNTSLSAMLMRFRNSSTRALIVFHTHVDITIFADDLAVDLSSRLAVVHRELRTVVALATRDGGAPRDVGAHAPVAHPRTLFVGALNSVAVATLEDLALDLVRRLLVAGWRRDPAGDLLALLLVLEETADQWDHGGGDRDPAHHESTSGFRVFLDLGGFSFGIGEAGGVSGRDDE
ncbi:reverse transcriptase, partial [Globisporangium splendens]